jgi:hypothetical protein
VLIDSIKEEGYGYRLSEVNVFVDRELCGQLPSDPVYNTSYLITCPTPITGTEIYLENTKSGHYLSFTGV